MHPPDQQREDGGESLHQECVKVAFEQWIERLQHTYLSAVVE